MKLMSHWAFRVFLGISLLLAASCGNKESQPEEFNVSGIVLPSSVEGVAGEPLSFSVLGGHGPAASDQVVLTGSKSWSIDILSASEKSFSFLLPKDAVTGNYSLSVKRNSQTKAVGSFRLIVKSGDSIDPKGSSVYGQVLCDGRPVAGVVVSDGVLTTLTGEDGIYRLGSEKYHGYVFMSVPSGYEPLSEGILPRIFVTLEADKTVPERADFALVKADGQENHTMIMLGDIHLANRVTGDLNQFDVFVKDLNAFSASLSGKVYGATLGDMTWDYYWLANNFGYQQYLNKANGIRGLTVYHTIGNHDHSMFEVGDFNTVKEYKKLIGPTYYSFNIGKVHYVVLDDVECTNAASATETDDNGNAGYKRTYRANLVQQQMDWLRKDLSYVSKDTPLVITMHIPLYKPDGTYRMLTSSAVALEALLKEYSQVHLYTAHTHTTYHVDHQATDHIFEHNAGSICGTWWWSASETPGVHIGQDGSPGGYTVMDVKGNTLSWQYKATGSNPDYQFRSYDRNGILLTPEKYVPAYQARQPEFVPGLWGTSDTANEVYLNVWNYDPSWKVEVSENGTPLEVSYVSVKDPLHLIAYTAKRLNKGKDAGFATTDDTHHMFKVTASSATSTLDIKVTDRFGNVYTESMKRPKAFDTKTYAK